MSTEENPMVASIKKLDTAFDKYRDGSVKNSGCHAPPYRGPGGPCKSVGQEPPGEYESREHVKLFDDWLRKPKHPETNRSLR